MACGKGCCTGMSTSGRLLSARPVGALIAPAGRFVEDFPGGATRDTPVSLAGAALISERRRLCKDEEAVGDGDEPSSAGGFMAVAQPDNKRTTPAIHAVLIKAKLIPSVIRIPYAHAGGEAVVPEWLSRDRNRLSNFSSAIERL